jgi:hypothetical protein
LPYSVDCYTELAQNNQEDDDDPYLRALAEMKRSALDHTKILQVDFCFLLGRRSDEIPSAEMLLTISMAINVQ